MNLLIFFALPLATILLAIVFQKVLRNPILVAITFFAIYLIVSFVFFTDTLAEALIATIIYTIIAYITALIVKFICKLRHIFCDNNHHRRSPIGNLGEQDDVLDSNRGRRCGCGCNHCNNDNDDDNNNGNVNNDLLSIDCNCANGGSSNLLTVSSNCLNGNENRSIENSINDNNILNVTDSVRNSTNVAIPVTYNNPYQYNIRRRYRR